LVSSHKYYCSKNYFRGIESLQASLCKEKWKKLELFWTLTKDTKQKQNLENLAVLSMKCQLSTPELEQIRDVLRELFTQCKLQQAKNLEEKAKKAMVDTTRLADELHSAQDHVSVLSKTIRTLETQMAEMENQLADANENALRSGKNAMAKLKSRN
jgi:hypothetical protein